MLTPIFFFLFNALLTPCDAKALLEARDNEGIIFWRNLLHMVK